METRCDPRLQQELDRINAEIDLEDELAEASEVMEVEELLNSARMRGETYGIGYEKGFWRGLNFYANKQSARMESISAKHRELNKRWGLDF